MLIVEMIVIQGLTFLGLVLLLKKVLYSNFAKQIKRLEALNQETEKKRRELQAKIEETERAFEAKVKEHEEIAAGIRRDAEDEAEETRARTAGEARREAERIIEEARMREEEIRKQYEIEAGEKAARLAGDALRYVLASRFDEAIHHQLVKDLVQELEGLDGKRLNGHGQEAQVTIPFDLKEEEKSKLADMLEKKAKRKIRLVAQIDRSLIAGMILRFENVILDGSLKTRLKDAVSYVRKAERKT